MEILKNLREEFMDFSDWNKYVNDDKKKAYYKYDEEKGVMTQYYESIIDASYEYFGGVMLDVNKFKDWMPLVTKSQELARITKQRRIIYTFSEVPKFFPIANRENFYSFRGFPL